MNDAATNGAYDVSGIRADFPILATQVYGKPLVYLDNAASAQKPKAVLDRLTDQAHIIETGSESYRFRRTRSKKQKQSSSNTMMPE